MQTWFELWDTAAASLVGSFGTQAAALAIVRRSLREHGPDSVGSLVLTEETPDGEPAIIAAGDELAELARNRPPQFAGLGEFTISGDRIVGAERSFETSVRGNRISFGEDVATAASAPWAR